MIYSITYYFIIQLLYYPDISIHINYSIDNSHPHMLDNSMAALYMFCKYSNMRDKSPIIDSIRPGKQTRSQLLCSIYDLENSTRNICYHPIRILLYCMLCTMLNSHSKRSLTSTSHRLAGLSSCRSLMGNSVRMILWYLRQNNQPCIGMPSHILHSDSHMWSLGTLGSSTNICLNTNSD